MLPNFKDSRLWLSGQMNFVFQTHPPFRAKYSGRNSLIPPYEKATSRVVTLYSGVRINNPTEILLDVEEAGASALSTGLGVAGFPNLDIMRNPLLSKAPYLARGMFHKVFALSKDSIEAERSPLPLFEQLPRRRLEIRVGKFSTVDFFDQNPVGSDTHFQFLNWAVDNNAAYDYAADTRGYTVGVIADYEDRDWGFRFAEALMPKVANGIDLVWQSWKAHAENFEFQWRRGVIPRKAGAIRLLGYGGSWVPITSGVLGSCAIPGVSSREIRDEGGINLGVFRKNVFTPAGAWFFSGLSIHSLQRGLYFMPLRGWNEICCRADTSAGGNLIASGVWYEARESALTDAEKGSTCW